MAFKDLLKAEEAALKARDEKVLAELNATEATWGGWIKANKGALILCVIALVMVIAIFSKF
ncbi:MAG: hypothetical protein M3O26_10690 [Pseudomonadota bacterium]|nr:hypothetical protein [Pseudomonadota bacterium]